LYEQGRGGLAKDECEAARLYKLAADPGNAGVGGLSKNRSEAERLYKLAADQGNEYAQNAPKRLGVEY
jgi:hypothetical protein